MTGIDRFLDKVFMLPDLPGCWIWMGAAKADGTGYGGFFLDGKHDGAHRASWRLHRGEMPVSMCVLHRCDTPLCVNPNHLFLGTQIENIKDMDMKGRARRTGPGSGGATRGEKNARALITASIAAEIAALKGTATQAAIGRMFKVSSQLVGAIHRGELWRHSLGALNG